jgi:uncharacterized cupin superfamily protein
MALIMSRTAHDFAAIRSRLMVPEAPLEPNDAGGLYPAGEGWFVVNVRDAQWFDATPLGLYTPFEGEHARFAQVGVNIGVLRPGEPSCMYHAEDAQEDFLVLAGECLLVIEGQERRLQQWDFVHCPPLTRHVFVGAGEEPCVLLGMGARRKGRSLVYPVDGAALAHGAGVERETALPEEAYARFPEPSPTPCPEELLG